VLDEAVEEEVEVEETKEIGRREVLTVASPPKEGEGRRGASSEAAAAAAAARTRAVAEAAGVERGRDG